jgi:iron complex outermembrane receptor protein
MGRESNWIAGWSALAAWAILPCAAAFAAPPSYVSPVNGGISMYSGNFVLTKQQEAQGQPLDVPTEDPTAQGATGQPFDTAEQQFQDASFGPNYNLDEVFQELDAGTPPPNAEAVGGNQSELLGTNDTGQLLQYASSVKTVEVQRRSPVSFDPRIRGFHLGQVYAQYDGAYYFPVRQDLDTMLSKFDPSLIDTIVVVPGPYGVRYGPGFSFIDVIGVQTPRYCNGPETHSSVGMNYQTNGEQLYGRATVLGGGADYGYIFNYGNRNGSDYDAGGGVQIPSTYHNRNYLGQFGFNLSPEDSIEVKYNRLDQSDTEYPGQFFDVRFLTTDATSATFLHQDDCSCWSRFTLTGWYNRTRFAGDTFNDSKQTFNVINRVEAALDQGPGTFDGTTDGHLLSTGARASATYGQQDETQLTVGSDLHYLEQNIVEDFSSIGSTPFNVETNLPTSFWLDPGVYTELSLPVQSYWTTTIGARADFSRTSLRESDLRDNSALIDPSSQSDILWASYLTNEVELSQGWTGRFGAGYAERPPTLLERYADGVFISLIQSGFSRVIGTPDLDKERNTQFDVSLSADFDNWRGRIGGFQSFVNDYVTFIGNVIVDPVGARLLRTINTDLATLSGAEISGEYDLNRRWTAFGSARYIYGRDQEIDAPLPGIYPFDSRLGLRMHDLNGGRRWGIEGNVRIVDDQNQLGVLRIGSTQVIGEDTFELRTPGFTVYNLRGYYNVTDNFNVIGGIDNVFDKQYLEHLDLRYAAQPLPGGGQIPGTRVLSPGFSPYMGVEWTY